MQYSGAGATHEAKIYTHPRPFQVVLAVLVCAAQESQCMGGQVALLDVLTTLYIYTGTLLFLPAYDKKSSTFTSRMQLPSHARQRTGANATVVNIICRIILQIVPLSSHLAPRDTQTVAPSITSVIHLRYVVDAVINPPPPLSPPYRRIIDARMQDKHGASTSLSPLSAPPIQARGPAHQHQRRAEQPPPLPGWRARRWVYIEDEDSQTTPAACADALDLLDFGGGFRHRFAYLRLKSGGRVETSASALIVHGHVPRLSALQHTGPESSRPPHLSSAPTTRGATLYLPPPQTSPSTPLVLATRDLRAVVHYPSLPHRRFAHPVPTVPGNTPIYVLLPARLLVCLFLRAQLLCIPAGRSESGTLGSGPGSVIHPRERWNHDILPISPPVWSACASFLPSRHPHALPHAPPSRRSEDMHLHASLLLLDAPPSVSTLLTLTAARTARASPLTPAAHLFRTLLLLLLSLYLVIAEGDMRLLRASSARCPSLEVRNAQRHECAMNSPTPTPALLCCTSLRRTRAPAVTSSVSPRPSYQPVQTQGRRRGGEMESTRASASSALLDPNAGFLPIGLMVGDACRTATKGERAERFGLGIKQYFDFLMLRL
ncbi:hypothetical protein B0H13DRAFT_2325979 [Mycena leptocephala]|nr:hypothetical protein B0H13DRAFT_2325979 [Mycena leptocephala]